MPMKPASLMDLSLSDSPSFAEEEDARPRSSRAHEIRNVLQEEIESGRLVPGTPLDERELAIRFQVSRTPVREALQQLAAIDLVSVLPRQGVRVARLTINQVRAIMETVGELETLAAKLAARRVDAALRAELDRTMQLCQDATIQGDSDRYSEANHAFHEAIYAGSRNPYLADLIRKARRQMHRYRIKNFHTKSQIGKSLHGHMQIARAIADGDEAAAAHAMQLHVPAGSTGFSEFLARMPVHFFESESGSF